MSSREFGGLGVTGHPTDLYEEWHAPHISSREVAQGVHPSIKPRHERSSTMDFEDPILPIDVVDQLFEERPGVPEH